MITKVRCHKMKKSDNCLFTWKLSNVQNRMLVLTMLACKSHKYLSIAMTDECVNVILNLSSEVLTLLWVS